MAEEDNLEFLNFQRERMKKFPLVTWPVFSQNKRADTHTHTHKHPLDLIKNTILWLLSHDMPVPHSDWQLIKLCIGDVAAMSPVRTHAVPLDCVTAVLPFEAKIGVTTADDCKWSCPKTELQQLTLQHEKGYWFSSFQDNLLQKYWNTQGCPCTAALLWHCCLFSHHTSLTIHFIRKTIYIFCTNIHEL